MDIEERRSTVYHLLTECVDQKLLRGGTDNAIAKANEAYRLATFEPQLVSPWPQLAAYRLAHLRMRSEEGDLKSLYETDRLFTEASRGNGLGPLPHIYALAILSRIKSAVKEDSEKQAVASRIADALEHP